ncbi:MAG: hypothetical protein ACI93N_000800 [Flavobacteriaceae bacterium]|jgi:hypothetical protein
MKLRTLITFLYLLFSIPLFLFFKSEVTVWLSFFINYLLITSIAYYHLNKEKSFSPFLTSYIVFIFLFFLVAPIIQISSMELRGLVFPNNYPYSKPEILFANFLIFIFNALFFLSYIYFKKRYYKSQINYNQTTYSTPLVIFILFICCITIWAMNLGYVLEDIDTSVYMAKEESVSGKLIKRKVLFLIPFGAIVITHRYLKVKNKINWNTIICFLFLLILILILFFLKNPLTEKRNALGPIYITLIYLFLPKTLNSNPKYFLFLFVSMILAFPLMSALTHVDANLKEIISNPKVVSDYFIERGGLSQTFSTLHYDAYANIMATVDFVSQEGFSFGYQLLSSILFFVPRSIWTSKPNSTGEIVGDYLIEQYSFGDGHFNNLSNSIVSEGYVNFGVLGVILLSISLAFIIVKFINWLHSGSPLKEIIAFYLAVHLMFLLRGDLTNGLAYFIGPFIGIYIIPKIIMKILKKVRIS